MVENETLYHMTEEDMLNASTDAINFIINTLESDERQYEQAQQPQGEDLDLNEIEELIQQMEQDNKLDLESTSYTPQEINDIINNAVINNNLIQNNQYMGMVVTLDDRESNKCGNIPTTNDKQFVGMVVTFNDGESNNIPITNDKQFVGMVVTLDDGESNNMPTTNDKQVSSLEELQPCVTTKADILSIIHRGDFNRVIVGCFVRLQISDQLARQTIAISNRGIGCDPNFMLARIFQADDMETINCLDGIYHKKRLLFSHPNIESGVFEIELDAICQLEEPPTEWEFREWLQEANTSEFQKTSKQYYLRLPLITFVNKKGAQLDNCICIATKKNELNKYEEINEKYKRQYEESRHKPNLLLSNIAELKRIFLRRSQIIRLAKLPNFTKVIMGAFVRFLYYVPEDGNDDVQQSAEKEFKYKIVQIIGSEQSTEPYHVGRLEVDKTLKLEWNGDLVSARINSVSEMLPSDDEFNEWMCAGIKTNMVTSLKFLLSKAATIEKALHQATNTDTEPQQNSFVSNSTINAGVNITTSSRANIVTNGTRPSKSTVQEHQSELGNGGNNGNINARPKRQCVLIKDVAKTTTTPVTKQRRKIQQDQITKKEEPNKGQNKNQKQDVEIKEPQPPSPVLTRIQTSWEMIKNASNRNSKKQAQRGGKRTRQQQEHPDENVTKRSRKLAIMLRLSVEKEPTPLSDLEKELFKKNKFKNVEIQIDNKGFEEAYRTALAALRLAKEQTTTTTNSSRSSSSATSTSSVVHTSKKRNLIYKKHTHRFVGMQPTLPPMSQKEVNLRTIQTVLFPPEDQQNEVEMLEVSQFTAQEAIVLDDGDDALFLQNGANETIEENRGNAATAVLKEVGPITLNSLHTENEQTQEEQLAEQQQKIQVNMVGGNGDNNDDDQPDDRIFIYQ